MSRVCRTGWPSSIRRIALRSTVANRVVSTTGRLRRSSTGRCWRYADAGLRRGDVLVTQLPNVVEYVATYLAASRLGIVAEPGADAVPTRGA